MSRIETAVHHPIAGKALLAALNHLLEMQPQVKARLARRAGKTVQLDIPPLRLPFVIDADGSIAQAQSGAMADALLDVPPAAVPRLFSSDVPPAGLIRMEGDAALAAEVGEILRGLHWDAEEDLSRVFGDALAHRMAGAAASLFEWQKEAGLNVAKALAQYWTEEQPVLAKPAQVEEFIRRVDELRDGAERLEKRLERLERHLSDSDRTPQ